MIAIDTRKIWDMTDQEVIEVACLAVGVQGGVWVTTWVESYGWGAVCINSRRRMFVFLTHKFDLRVSVELRGDSRLIPAQNQKDIYKYLMEIGVLRF